MRKNYRKSRSIPLIPNIFVFCEGETEKEYINFIRTNWRLPLHFIPIKSKSNIDNITINKTLNNYERTNNDAVFIMFDLDVPGIFENLNRLNNVVLLISNPCFELWLLLHFQNQTSFLTTDSCIKLLSFHIRDYKKGLIRNNFQDPLKINLKDAIFRARNLNVPKNPSTSVFRLFDHINLLSSAKILI